MAADCIALLDSVRTKLDAAKGVIALDAGRGKPASEEDVANAEKRIGVPLPPGLKALYLGAASLHWSVEDEPALGYDLDDSPLGQLELLPIGQLEVKSGLVRFSNDGYGNGFCLDLDKASKGVIPIAWWDHDSRRHAPEARSFDTFFSAWAKVGFVSERSADGEIEPIIRYLRTGKLPKTKAPPAPAGPKLPASLRSLPGHSGVCAVALFPDGRRAVSGGYDGVVRIFEVESGKVEREARVAGMTFALAVSPDGRRVLSVGDGGACFLEVDTGKVGKIFGAAAMAAAFIGEGVVLGLQDGAIASYSASGKLGWSVKAHPGPVHRIEIDASGRIVSLGNSKAAARLSAHDAKTGDELMRLEGAFLRAGADFALTTDRRRVLIALATGKVATIDLDAPEPPAEVASTEGKPFYRVAMLDEQTLLAAVEGVEVQAWSLGTGKVTRTLKIAKGGIPSALVPRRDGRHVVVGGYAGWLGEWAAR